MQQYKHLDMSPNCLLQKLLKVFKSISRTHYALISALQHADKVMSSESWHTKIEDLRLSLPAEIPLITLSVQVVCKLHTSCKLLCTSCMQGLYMLALGT